MPGGGTRALSHGRDLPRAGRILLPYLLDLLAKRIPNLPVGEKRVTGMNLTHKEGHRRSAIRLSFPHCNLIRKDRRHLNRSDRKAARSAERHRRQTRTPLRIKKRPAMGRGSVLYLPRERASLARLINFTPGECSSIPLSPPAKWIRLRNCVLNLDSVRVNWENCLKQNAPSWTGRPLPRPRTREHRGVVLHHSPAWLAHMRC